MVAESTLPNVESSTATQPRELEIGSQMDGSSMHTVAGSGRSAPARRQLRTRPSDPVSAPSPHGKRRKSEVSTSLRRATESELEYIHSKLGHEHLSSRRDVVVKDKEAELRDVVDKHDTAVKEKFHLERYISIFEGWNPKVRIRTIYMTLLDDL